MIFSSVSTTKEQCEGVADTFALLGFLARTVDRYPFHTYFPHGHGIVSVGCFFFIGCLQTGQFLLHIFASKSALS